MTSQPLLSLLSIGKKLILLSAAVFHEQGVKSGKIPVFLLCFLNSIQSTWLHFGKQGRDTLNIDRMIQQFWFITADEIHTFNDIQITLIQHEVWVGQLGG